MTLKELKNRVSFRWIGYGTFKVTVIFRNEEYSCTSHNTLATDRITGSDDWNSDREIQLGYTTKQAYQALYDECCRTNNLGKYY